MNLSLDDMKGEEWVDIPQFDGYISVSNYGRVWAVPRPVHAMDGKVYYTKERIRKQSMAWYYNSYTKDYTEQLSVHIRYNGFSHNYKVNRLVYELFVGPIHDEKLVVHKDGDNCNNRAENLVLMNGTQLYAHGLKINRRPRFSSSSRKGIRLVWSDENSPRPIVQYTLEGKKVKEYESLADAARAIGSFRGSIRDVAKGKVKQLHGFVYRYKGDGYKGEYADFSLEKTVTQFSREGKKIASYPSVKAASLKTGIDADLISKCARRKIPLSGGYAWRYQGDVYRGEYKDAFTNSARPVVQYSLDGKKVARFQSVNQASIVTGFSAATLLDCACKRSKVSHGFVWRFEGDVYNGEYRYYTRGKAVTQFTREGKKMRTYPTIEAAAKIAGLTPDNIQKNVQRENKTAGGFVWKYATKKEIQDLPLFKPAKYTNTRGGKEIIQYSLEGKKLASFPSIAEAAKTTRIGFSNISRVLNASQGTAGGFVWRTNANRYRGELATQMPASKGRIVTQYDLSGKKVRVFKSTKEAERKTGVYASAISIVAKGKLKTTGGFIWRYGDGSKKISVTAHFASTREHVKRISKPVVKYSLEGERIAEYPSIAAAARAEGVAINRISSAVNGKTKSAIGFVWELKRSSNTAR